MIDQHTLFEIHRLHAEGLSQRKIAFRLNLSRATVKRHLCHPQIVRKKIQQLLKLLEQYGLDALLIALEKALHYKAFGIDYVKNILFQQSRPLSHQPPVVLKQEALNHIRLTPHALAEYDALVLQRKKEGR